MKNKRFEEQKRIQNDFLSAYVISPDEIEHFKTVILMVLKDVDYVCRKNNIYYFCGYGTMLGAIRHKGFIPWDDDIDICIMRKDLETLQKCLYEEFPSKYTMSLPGKTKHDPCRFAKIMLNGTLYVEVEYAGQRWGKDFWRGIGIDVFVLDYIPVNSVHRFAKKIINIFTSTAASCCMAFRHPSPVLLSLYKNNEFRNFYRKRRIIGFLLSFLSTNCWVRLHCALVAYKKETELLTSAFSAWSYNIVIKREWVKETIDWPFENITVKVPKMFNEYLTERYGDWKAIPPESKRDKHIVYKIGFGKY